MTTPAPTPDPYALPDVSGLTIGVLGGTGEQGRGLARRLAMAGCEVVLGSRDAGRAAEAASALPGSVRGMSNEDCAAASDVVIVAVPWDGHGALLESLSGALAGKIVVDCVNPLGFDKQGAFALPVPEGSAAQQAASVLPDARVVAAFHHISAVLLLDESVDSIDTDVLVLGDDRESCPGDARGLRRPPAQRRPGRGLHGQPDLNEPALQGPRGRAHHRRLRAGRGSTRRRVRERGRRLNAHRRPSPLRQCRGSCAGRRRP